MSRIKAELIDGMYVVGDEAYLPSDWERLQKRRARDAAYKRRNREKVRAQVAKWRAEHPERVREYNREYMARTRKGSAYRKLQVVGSLHDLRCFGPTKRTGCYCRKQLIVREVK
jgi:hypothetical protein